MERQDTLHYHFTKAFCELEKRLTQRVFEVFESNAMTTNHSPEKERLLKDVEVCEHLQISTAHFYKLKKAHKDFPVYDIKGAKRYKASEVEQFFKSLKRN